MTLENNPIYQLVKDVLEGRLSLKKAMNFFGSGFYIRKMQNIHAQEIFIHIQTMVDQDILDVAMKYIEVTRRLCESQRHLLFEISLCDFFQARIYNQTGRFKDAVKLLEKCQKFFEKGQMILQVGMCNFRMADSLRQLGFYDKAIEFYYSAATIYRTHEMLSGFADCLMNMGMAFQQKGFFDEAKFHFDSAMKIYIENDMLEQSAWCSMYIAALHQDYQQYELVQNRYIYAREVFVKLRAQRGLAFCDLNESNYYHQIGRKESAFKLISSAQEFFIGCKDIVSIAQCSRNIILFNFFIIGDEDPNFAQLLANQLILLERARSFFYESKMQADLAICESTCGIIYSRMGRHYEALKKLRTAQTIFEKINLSQFYGVQLQIGIVYEELRQYERALNIFYGLINNDGITQTVRWKALYGTARILTLQEKTQEALFIYKKACTAVESIRWTIMDYESRSSFLGTTAGLYYSTVQCCLVQNDFKAAVEYVERLKSRSLAELIANKNVMPKNTTEEKNHEYQRLRFQMKALAHQLSKSENHDRSVNIKEELDLIERKHEQMLLDFRKKDYQFDPDQKVVITYPEIKALIKDRESALIELFPMADKTIAFVVSETCKIEDSTVIISDYTIKNLYEHIDKLFEKYNAWQADTKKRADWEACLDTILKELHEKIFLKIQPHLDGIRKIILIPFHAFHLLPLHAMFSEDNGQRHYIIDDYQVSFAPSAKILKYCLGRRRERNGKVTIAFSNPDDTKWLRSAKGEADFIQNLFDKTVQIETVQIEEATKKNIKEHGLYTHILHYAGHATSTALILHDEIDKEKSEIFNVEDIIATLDLPEAYLATLSACETGITKLGKTDEFIGLTSGLLHAGAASVICSLWTVDDIFTSILMKKMYTNIKNGKGKAESLRDAQLWLKDPNNRQEHINMLPEELRGKEHLIPTDLSKQPYYWAGFVCSGVE